MPVLTIALNVENEVIEQVRATPGATATFSVALDAEQIAAASEYDARRAAERAQWAEQLIPHLEPVVRAQAEKLAAAIVPVEVERLAVMRTGERQAQQQADAARLSAMWEELYSEKSKLTAAWSRLESEKSKAERMAADATFKLQRAEAMRAGGDPADRRRIAELTGEVTELRAQLAAARQAAATTQPQVVNVHMPTGGVVAKVEMPATREELVIQRDEYGLMTRATKVVEPVE